MEHHIYYYSGASYIATRAPATANNDDVMEDLNASGTDKHWVGQFQHQNMDEYCFDFSTIAAKSNIFIVYGNIVLVRTHILNIKSITRVQREPATRI